MNMYIRNDQDTVYETTYKRFLKTANEAINRVLDA